MFQLCFSKGMKNKTKNEEKEMLNYSHATKQSTDVFISIVTMKGTKALWALCTKANMNDPVLQIKNLTMGISNVAHSIVHRCTVAPLCTILTKFAIPLLA